MRRVTPVYFFRLPLPEALPAGGAPPGLDGPGNRLAVRIDPVGKSFTWCSCPRRKSRARRLPFAGASRVLQVRAWGGRRSDRKASHSASGDSAFALRNSGGRRAVQIPSPADCRGRQHLAAYLQRRFSWRKNDAKVHVWLPLDTWHARVFDVPKTLNPELTVEPLPAKKGEELRGILVKAPKPGPHRLIVQVDIHLSDRRGWRPNLPPASLSSQLRAHLLRDEKGIEASDPAVQRTLERLGGGQGSKAELVGRIFAHCVEIDSGGENDPRTAVAALDKGVASPLGRARAMVALCRAAKIPARLMTGFEIKRVNNLRPQTWVEALVGDSWESYDPDAGYHGEMPHDFMPVRRDAIGDRPLGRGDRSGRQVRDCRRCRRRRAPSTCKAITPWTF